MVPVSKEPGDLASQYNSFLETEEINDVAELRNMTLPSTKEEN